MTVINKNIIGEKEKSHNAVAIRKLGSKNVETLLLEDFIKITKNQINLPWSNIF